MIGFALMGLGGLIFISGAVVYGSAKKENTIKSNVQQLEHLGDLAAADGVLTKKEEKKIIDLAKEYKMDSEPYLQQARKRIEESEEDSETELINISKKKGDDFEKFILKKFDFEYFTLKDWAGDKYDDGVYAETTQQPDIKVELKTSKDTVLLWIECKWRAKATNGMVEVAYPAQFERYKQYQLEKKIPVFIALGIGGKANAPADLYLVPLDELNSGKVKLDNVESYKKDVDEDFFYDVKKGGWR